MKHLQHAFLFLLVFVATASRSDPLSFTRYSSQQPDTAKSLLNGVKSIPSERLIRPVVIEGSEPAPLSLDGLPEDTGFVREKDSAKAYEWLLRKIASIEQAANDLEAEEDDTSRLVLRDEPLPTIDSDRASTSIANVVYQEGFPGESLWFGHTENKKQGEQQHDDGGGEDDSETADQVEDSAPLSEEALHSELGQHLRQVRQNLGVGKSHAEGDDCTDWIDKARKQLKAALEQNPDMQQRLSPAGKAHHIAPTKEGIRQLLNRHFPVELGSGQIKVISLAVDPEKVDALKTLYATQSEERAEYFHMEAEWLLETGSRASRKAALPSLIVPLAQFLATELKDIEYQSGRAYLVEFVGQHFMVLALYRLKYGRYVAVLLDGGVGFNTNSPLLQVGSAELEVVTWALAAAVRLSGDDHLEILTFNRARLKDDASQFGFAFYDLEVLHAAGLGLGRGQLDRSKLFGQKSKSFRAISALWSAILAEYIKQSGLLWVNGQIPENLDANPAVTTETVLSVINGMFSVSTETIKAFGIDLSLELATFSHTDWLFFGALTHFPYQLLFPVQSTQSRTALEEHMTTLEKHYVKWHILEHTGNLHAPVVFIGCEIRGCYSLPRNLFPQVRNLELISELLEP